MIQVNLRGSASSIERMRYEMSKVGIEMVSINEPLATFLETAFNVPSVVPIDAVTLDGFEFYCVSGRTHVSMIRKNEENQEVSVHEISTTYLYARVTILAEVELFRMVSSTEKRFERFNIELSAVESEPGQWNPWKIGLF